MRFHFLAIFLLISMSSLFAGNINIEKENLPYIGKSLQYFEDENSSYTIDTINQKEQAFIPYDKKAFLSFFTNSTYWLKFTLINNNPESLERYFVVDAPWIDSINIYIYDPQRRLTTYKLGTLLPFKERSMQINLLNQVHSFSKGKHEVYFQIKTRDPFIIALSIFSQEALYEKILDNNLVEKSIYSIVSALLIFNLLIFIITRYSTYFFYCLYLASYLIMSLSYESYTFQYIFYDYPNIQNWLQSIPILFYLLCSILFAKYFLELKKNLPKINKYANIVLKIHIIMILLTSTIGYQATIFYATCITPFFSFYMLYLGIYSYIKGNKKALFFILATIFGCTGAFFTALVASSFIPYNWYFFKGVDIGMMIDSILFSIALAYRYTSLNLVLEKTKNEVIELNTNLEKNVKDRTKKLNQELENRTVLLKELSHRVKNNLQIISVFLSMDKEKIKDEFSQKIIEENISRIKSISILYENFLDADNPSKVDVDSYITKYLDEYKKGLKDISVQVGFKAKKIVLNQKDLIPLGLVINELITNSVKYAFTGCSSKKIDILFSQDGKNIYFEYHDNGVGANIEKLKKGFGYDLLTALVEFQLEGSILCKNKNGLSYYITIPIQ